MRIRDLVNICDTRTSDGDYINNKCDLTAQPGGFPKREFQVKEQQQSRLMVNHMADPAATQSLVII